MLKKYQIVMFSMSSYSEWQGVVENRNFHILQNLLKNPRIEKIITVDYLPHTWKRTYKNWKNNIIKKSNLPVIKKGWLTKIFKASDKLLVYSSVMPKIYKRKFYHDLNAFLVKNGFKDYLVWSFYPLDVQYFDSLPAKFFIFDTVDNWAEHPSYAEFRETLLGNYKTISQKANIIFTVSNDLQKIYDNQQKVHWIANGVDLKHFQQKYPIINRDIGEIKKPIIGYVGTIQDRVDIDLIEYLATHNPEISFVLIGPVWYPVIEERLKKQPNIYFLGRKPYQEVPMYIQQFAVGIIPHKVDQFVKSTNPMKVYEYLACQKPVVATPGSDIEIFKDVVYIAGNSEQFNDCLKKALAQDNEAAGEKRLEAVKEHAWVKKVDEMLDLIDQKI